MKYHFTSYITFGDRGKGEIKGVGRLDCYGFPKLNDMFLVKGLTANLISISQLCDQGLKVNFTKSECLVTNEKGEVIIKGARSKENCYLWISQDSSYTSTCSLTEEGRVYGECQTEKKIEMTYQKIQHLTDSKVNETCEYGMLYG